MGKKKITILDELVNEQVVSFGLHEDKKTMCIQECCDYYFLLNISKLKVKELIDELNIMYNEMKS